MRRRAPGGGRKPLKPDDRSSEILSVRIRPDVRRALERLANKNRRSLSREMQRALESWIGRHHSRPPHIGALGEIAVQLGQFAELFTRKKWSDDPFTAQAIVAALNQLMTFLDLGGVAKGPAEMDLGSPKAFGDLVAFHGVVALHIAGIRPEEFAAALKARKASDGVTTEGVTTEFEALKRAFRNLGSRKQVLEKILERETFK